MCSHVRTKYHFLEGPLQEYVDEVLKDFKKTQLFKDAANKHADSGVGLRVPTAYLLAR